MQRQRPRRADSRIGLVVLFVVLALAMCWGMRRAQGSPLDCEALARPDARHFCRAEAKQDPAECELIKDPNLRHYCRAVVKK